MYLSKSKQHMGMQCEAPRENGNCRIQEVNLHAYTDTMNLLAKKKDYFEILKT